MDRIHATEIWNMNSPFGIQPRIKINVRRKSQHSNESYIYTNPDTQPWESIFSLGSYFIKTADHTSADRPLFFSYVYYLWRQLPYAFSRENGGHAVFSDLAVAGTRGYYRFGYTVLTPVKRTISAADQQQQQYNLYNSHAAFGNDTVDGPVYQCNFISVQQDVWQNSGYEGIWKGPHMYWGVPLLVIGFTANTLLFMCCAHRFEDASLDKSESEFSFSDRSYMRGQHSKKHFLLRLKDVILSVFLASDEKIVEHCGTDMYFFLWFQKYLMVFVFACGVVSMVVLLPVYLSSADFDFYQDFAASTVAALKFKSNPKSYFQLIVTICFPLIGCIFLWRVRWLARVILRINNEYPSLFTVMVSGIPSDMKDKKELIDELGLTFGKESIVDAHICFKLNKIAKYWKGVRESQSLLKLFEKEEKETGERPNIRQCCVCFKKDAIKHYTYELERYTRMFNNAKRSTLLETSGYAFVTFNSLAKVKEVLKSQRLKYCCGCKVPSWLGWLNCCIPYRSYAISAAPEPEEIKFNNLHYSSFSRWIRTLISNSAMSIALMVIYAVTFAISVYQHQKGLNFTTINEWGNALGSTFIVQAVIDLIPEICGVVNELVKPVVAWGSKFEKHPTRKSKRKSIVNKTAFYMVANMLILPNIYVYVKSVILVNFFAEEPFNNYTYFFNFTASGMIFLIVILCTIAKGLELTSMFLGMVIGYWKTHRLIRPKYDYDGSMGFRVAILMVMLIYGSVAPVVIPFILAFFMYSYFMDKYWIMYYFRRSPNSNGKILRTVANTVSYYFCIFPFLILIMMPSLFTLLQTWIVYIPCCIGLIVLLNLLKMRTNAQKRDHVILGITRAQEEVPAAPMMNLQTPTVVSEEAPQPSSLPEDEYGNTDDGNVAHTGTIDIDEEVNNYEEQLNNAGAGNSVAQSVLQARPGLLGKASDSLKTLWENHVLALFCVREKILKDEEIEKVSANLKLLSSRYENPVLTALLKQRKRQLQQDKEHQQQVMAASAVNHDGNNPHSFDEHSPTAY